MDDSVDWYSTVLGTRPGYRSDVWTSIGVGDGYLALHRGDGPDRGNIGLSLVATEPLEDLVERLEASGVPLERGIQDETFGRSILLKDPEGRLIQVNEHESVD